MGCLLDQLLSDGMNGELLDNGLTVDNDDYEANRRRIGWSRGRSLVGGDLHYTEDERGFPGPFGSDQPALTAESISSREGTTPAPSEGSRFHAAVTADRAAVRPGSTVRQRFRESLRNVGGVLAPLERRRTAGRCGH